MIRLTEPVSESLFQHKRVGCALGAEHRKRIADVELTLSIQRPEGPLFRSDVCEKA